MKVLDSEFAKGFLGMAENCWKMGWHERNGGNMSYRLRPEEAESVREDFYAEPKPWTPIDASIPSLAGNFFMVTGSGKFFQNTLREPEDATAIVELDDKGENYRIVWGLVNGGRPTSELPSHLLNHAVKIEATGGKNRVIYHCHPANVIALSYVLPLEDAVWSRELWDTMTECPIIFPAGVGVLEWEVPGGRAIGLKSCEKMKTYDVIIWAHHGMFCAGESFDMAFGLAHTVDKAADILVKIISMGGRKRSISSDDFRRLAKDFNVDLNEKFL